MQAKTSILRPLGYAQVTGPAVSTPLVPPAGTSLIVIQCETQAIRWRDDGVDPTAAIGQPLAAGLEMQYTGSFVAFRYIQQAVSAVVNICYYGG